MKSLVMRVRAMRKRAPPTNPTPGKVTGRSRGGGSGGVGGDMD